MMNSLECVKNLEKAGVPREQAEAHVQIMAQIMEFNFVTREEFRTAMSEVHRELADIRHQIIQLESRMTIKLGAMLSLGIGILVAVLKMS